MSTHLVFKRTHSGAGDKYLCYSTWQINSHTLSCIHTLHVGLCNTKFSTHIHTFPLEPSVVQWWWWSQQVHWPIGPQKHNFQSIQNLIMEGNDVQERQLRIQTAAAFFSLYVAIIFLISAIAFPGFSPWGERAATINLMNDEWEQDVGEHAVCILMARDIRCILSFHGNQKSDQRWRICCLLGTNTVWLQFTIVHHYIFLQEI